MGFSFKKTIYILVIIDIIDILCYDCYYLYCFKGDVCFSCFGNFLKLSVEYF